MLLVVQVVLDQTSEGNLVIMELVEMGVKDTTDNRDMAVQEIQELLVLVLAALIAGGVVMYRRKKLADDLLKDAAEVFAYTAELLAAGDAIREAIFTCYQDLCGLLQQRGFLRRDFETVREFEFAIRQALQGVSEDALTALDNTFEMARYSREEMGAQHQDVALQALNRMAGELAQIQTIPQR